MLAQKGGHTGLEFCKKDLYNYLNNQGMERIEDIDDFVALSYLQAKADNDPMFFSKTMWPSAYMRDKFFCGI